MEHQDILPHVQRILLKFMPAEVVTQYTRSATIPYWTRAVTHPSVNVFHNYEKLEYLGDGSLELAFTIYTRDVRGIKEYSITNSLQNYYMSDQYQHIIVDKIGLGKIINVSPEIDLNYKVKSGSRTIPLGHKIKEDVSEAFFGALTIIGRNLWSKGGSKSASHPVEYMVDFFIWYFRDLDYLDVAKHGVQAVKTDFINLFDFFSQVSPQKKRFLKYNTFNKSLVFDKDFLSGIKKYSPEASEEVRQVMTSKGREENYYYINVFEIMDKYGFNNDWFLEEKLRTGFGDSFKAIAKEHGFTRFILERNNKGSYDLVAQGVDRDKNSVSKTLASFGKYETFDELKDEAIKILTDLYM